MTAGRGDLRSKEITRAEAERLIKDAGLVLAYTLKNDKGETEGKIWEAPDHPFEGIGYFAKKEARLDQYRNEYWSNYNKKLKAL